MTLEIEQKFRVADRAELRETLIAAGARFGPPVAQSDAYFNHPARDFAVTDEALRIRSVGAANVVTYKGPKQAHAVKTRREIELRIGDGRESTAAWAELLALLGFRAVETVHKQREEAAFVWQGREVAVALDSVEGLGEFCEIELCVEENEIATAQEIVQSLAQHLGLSEVERRSYLGLVLASKEPYRC